MVKKKAKIFTSTQQAFTDLLKKEKSKQFKAEAQVELRQLRRARGFEQQPIRTAIGRVAEVQAESQKRARKLIPMLQRAEKLEIMAVTLDEIPLIKDMERQRIQQTMIKDSFLNNVERQSRNLVTPNLKKLRLQEDIDVAGLPD